MTYVPVIDIAFRGVEHDVRTGGGILAGAVAFRFFLFVVPYVFVVVFAFGIGADAADTDPTDLARKSGIVGLAASAIDASTEVSRITQVFTLSLRRVGTRQRGSHARESPVRRPLVDLGRAGRQGRGD